MKNILKEKPLVWFSDFTKNQNYFSNDCACEIQTEVVLPKTNTKNVKYTNKDISTFKLDENLYIAWNKKIGTEINVINESVLKLISDATSLNANTDILNLLIKRNLISAENQEVDFQNTKTFSTWLHLSNNCNLDCSYCYLKKTNDKMSIETGLQSIKSIFYSSVKNQIKEVKLKFAGAEPMYNFDTVVQMQKLALELAKKHNIKLSSFLLTNGTLLTDKIITELRKLQFQVIISIDGIGKFHDFSRKFKNGGSSFKNVSDNIEKTKQANILNNVSITVTDNNITNLPDLVHFCIQKDYPFNINFYRENENSISQKLTLSENKIIKYMKKTFDIIENNLPNRNFLLSILDRVNLLSPHNYTCGVGQNYAVIDHEGILFKCPMEIGDNKSFTTIKAKDILTEIRTDKTQLQNISINEKIDCQDCDIKNYCTGGCPLVATNNNEISSKSPNCNIYKALYKDVLKLEAKRLLKYTTPHVLN